MSIMREIAATLSFGLLSSFARPRHLALTAAGFLIVSLTLMTLLTIPAGLEQLAGRTGRDDIVIVLPSSTLDESASTLAPDRAKLIENLPGITRDSQGRPIVAPQFVVTTRLHHPDGTTGAVLVRGVTPMFWSVVGDAARVIAGKPFANGTNELIAGRSAIHVFAALDTGTQMQMNRSPWRVSGEFTANGSLWDSELWTDIATLQAAYNAQGQITALWVRLDSPRSHATFLRSLQADPQLQGLRAIPQRDYYALQTAFLSRFIDGATIAISVVLGLGAILAIANALTMALTSRLREIAVLRAMGYRRGTVAAALFAEVLIIGIVCAGAALLFGWLSLDGHAIDSSTAWQAIRFHMEVTLSVVGWTFSYALLLGAISSAWPIWHVVHTPLVRALREE